MIKVSVIIPSLNEQKNIKRTIKSVLKQTLSRKDYEIILTDGKSKDKTVKIARSLVDKIISKKNKSIGHARNLGAAVAKGKYLVFLDADTEMSNTLLESVVNMFEKDKKVIGALVNYVFKSKYFINTLVSYLYNGLMRLIKLIAPKYIIVSGMCLIARKKEFDKIKGFDLSLHLNEDNDLYQRIRKYGKFIYLNENVYTSDRRYKKMGALKFIYHSMKSFYKFHFTKDFNGKYSRVDD